MRCYAASVPVRPVYRPILRKNERQGSSVFDVLACNHAVLVDESARANTYRRARACPECAAFVAKFAAEAAAKQAPVSAPRPPARAAPRKATRSAPRTKTAKKPR